mgnify:CR=1 FL=1
MARQIRAPKIRDRDRTETGTNIKNRDRTGTSNSGIRSGTGPAKIKNRGPVPDRDLEKIEVPGNPGDGYPKISFGRRAPNKIINSQPKKCSK